MTTPRAPTTTLPTRMVRRRVRAVLPAPTTAPIQTSNNCHSSDASPTPVTTAIAALAPQRLFQRGGYRGEIDQRHGVDRGQAKKERESIARAR